MIETWRRVLGVALVAFVVMLAPRARAQEDVDARREDAKKLADSAYDLMNKGVYGEALSLFRKADAKFHSPVFRVYIADCHEKMGHLVAARKELQSVADEQLAEYAPDTFRKSQEDARARLSAIDKRIPRVTIRVEGADNARVELDGTVVAASAPVRIDPGDHTVRAVTQDGRSDKKSFKVAESEQAAVSLSLGGVTSAEPQPYIEPEPVPEQPSEGRSYVPAGIAFGVGGAGLILAAVAGGLFITRADDLKTACEEDGDGNPDTCPDAEEIDDVELLGNLSTAGWVIAGVGTITGIVLCFVPGEDDTSATVYLSPSGLSIRGSF